MLDSTIKARKQVAALPLREDEAGGRQVMLMTSRETGRLVIPKGWPMKGRKDHRSAATEARQEAGLVGRVGTEPIGTYEYLKRHGSRAELCRVKVFLLEVDRQLPKWKERDQRSFLSLPLDEAADKADDAGLRSLIRQLASSY